MTVKRLTSFTYSFEKLRNGECLYVDKTESIWKLIQPTQEGYFLSRPRRFGKSLTVSTLKAIFEGRRELFDGLAISKKEYDWKPYPVIHLSFGDYSVVFDPVKELPEYLQTKLQEIASAYSIMLTNSTPGLCFGELIDELAKNDQVAILIDEYDKPILDNITSSQITQVQRILKGFFSVLKERNAKERFLFITGVSKFCHVSLFSDLNNLTDITMHRDYATMFGYTQSELEHYFSDRIEATAQAQNVPCLLYTSDAADE